MEKLGEDVQLPADILLDKLTQRGVLIVAEALLLAAVHLVALPEADKDDVVLLVLYLLCQLAQTVQVEPGLVFAFNLCCFREVHPVLPLVEVGAEG